MSLFQRDRRREMKGEGESLYRITTTAIRIIPDPLLTWLHQDICQYVWPARVWYKRAWRDQPSVFWLFQLASPCSLYHTSQFVQLIRTIGSGLQPGISLQQQQNNLSPASRGGLAVLGNSHVPDAFSTPVLYNLYMHRFHKHEEKSNWVTNIHPI